MIGDKPKPASSRWSCELILCVLLGLLVGAASAWGAQPESKAPSMDPAEASRYFREAKEISDRDGGRMWGVKLYGAMLFVDESTREVIANRPDYKETLVARGEVFTGSLPPEENVANTSKTWLSLTWTMLLWPLPENPFQRDVLMLHECFHGVQDQLGLGGKDASNDHLDTRDGRVWMELEWRALGAALLQPKESRKKAVQDALTFRAFRRSLFSEAAERERALELVEGIPEYTGITLCARDHRDAEDYAAARLAGAPAMTTYVRSFAYVTGPAYGLLLDDAKQDWRAGLKAPVDLSDLLARALDVAPPPDLKKAAEERAQAYGGKEIMAEEDRRAAKKSQEMASMRARFVDGPVLTAPTTEAFSYSFDPTNQVPIEGVGTVYPYIRISAAWGILEATRGALMLMREGMIAGVRVSAPKDPAARPLKGDGWTLNVKEGWGVLPSDRKGDYELRRSTLPQP